MTTSTTKAIDKKPCGRRCTVSLAVPGSVIDNTQNKQLATFVAGQIARAAAIFCVDELVVIDDSAPDDQGLVSSGAAFLARIAQFMETPQYLRKSLIQLHPDLQFAGLLPPLDAPHHLRVTEWKRYREGVILRSELGKGSFADIGLDRTAFVPQAIAPMTRVTLDVGDAATVKFMPDFGENMIIAKAVNPSAPRELHGLYWGYTTRIARGLTGLFKGGPFRDGYDLKIGTSERGEVIPSNMLQLPAFQHALITFGGLDGIERFYSADQGWAKRSPEDTFDMYLNTCPNQGSRTIRTEEAILISLACMQPAITRVLGTTR